MPELIELTKMMPRRRWSRFGLLLGGLSLLATGASCTMAFTAHVDTKGQFVLLQDPIALQLGAAGAIGLYPLIDRVPIVVVYGWMLAIGMTCFYLDGSLMQRLMGILVMVLNPSTDPTNAATAAELARCGEVAMEPIR